MKAHSEVQFERVNPLQHSDAIKSLYVREGEHASEFLAMFDGAYRIAVADGAWSRIGRDRSGEVVMHMACFPHRFSYQGQTIVGGIGGDLIAATRYRSLLPAFNLVKRIVDDAREDGIDFFYAAPNPNGQAVLKAAAFEIAGQLERFVLLLAGRTLLESPAVLVNRIWRRFKAAAENRTVHRWSAAQFDVAPWTEPKGPADRLVPVHTSTFYQRRIPRYPSSSDYWYTDAANPKDASAVMLVRGPEKGVSTILAVRTNAQANLPGMFAAVGTDQRLLGARRLQLITLVGSPLAEALRTAGFIPRSDLRPILLKVLSDTGRTVAAAAPDHWFITDADCDR